MTKSCQSPKCNKCAAFGCVLHPTQLEIIEMQRETLRMPSGLTVPNKSTAINKVEIVIGFMFVAAVMAFVIAGFIS